MYKIDYKQSIQTIQKSAVYAATILGVAGLTSLSISLSSMPATATTLDGSIQVNDALNKTPQGLSRGGDLNKNSDPFGSGGGQQKQEIFDPGAGAFEVGSGQAAPPPPPRKAPLSAFAQDSGQANFQQGIPQMGQQGGGMPGRPQNGFNNPNQQQGKQFDDEPELKLQWDAWHKNVAMNIYQRFSALSNKFFAHGLPLRAIVAYTVTRDGHITNAHLTEKSPNIIYNTLVLTVVNSINGDIGVLAFPQGSRRMAVEKAGDFTVNMGPQEGFRSTTGDAETVGGRR